MAGRASLRYEKFARHVNGRVSSDSSRSTSTKTDEPARFPTRCPQRMYVGWTAVCGRSQRQVRKAAATSIASSVVPEAALVAFVQAPHVDTVLMLPRIRFASKRRVRSSAWGGSSPYQLCFLGMDLVDGPIARPALTFGQPPYRANRQRPRRLDTLPSDVDRALEAELNWPRMLVRWRHKVIEYTPADAMRVDSRVGAAPACYAR